MIGHLLRKRRSAGPPSTVDGASALWPITARALPTGNRTYPPAAPARVLLVDDHGAVREGLRALLSAEPTLRVVGEATSGDEALGVALVLRPDLIVLDQEMPGTLGTDVLPKLRAILPATRVVMVTMSSGVLREAHLRGAAAVIAKDDMTGLVTTLRRLAATRGEAGPLAQPAAGPVIAVGSSRPLAVAGVALLYVVAFPQLIGWFGNQATDLAILVVAAAAASYGLRGGVVAATVALPINVLLLAMAGITAPGVGSVAHAVIAVAIGAAVGWLRDLRLHADAQARIVEAIGMALEASDRRLLALVEDAPVLLVSIDASGVIVDALGTGFGDHPKLSPEGLRGQQAAVVYDDNPELLARLSRALSGEEFSERVERYGYVYDIHFRPRRDRAGTFIGTTAVLVNVSGRVRAEERLERAALLDAVSGLPNRNLLQDRIEQALRTARRTGGAVAVLVLGIDNFKAVNNTYGHAAGDLLLREVAGRLRGAIRETDTLARVGGDEFAIILGGPVGGGQSVVLAKLRDALAEPFQVAERRLHVGASVGSAHFPDDGGDAGDLLRKAEIAMYAAKRSLVGHEVYRPEFDQYSARRMTLMTELREAIDAGALELQYQPVVSVPDGHLVMVEALVRWNHPERGQIPPLDFIPVAEETDLMKPLTDWVLAHAIDQCRRWLDAGRHVPIAVNLSVRNLVDETLADRILTLLAAAAVPASNLRVEITESVVMADAVRSLRTMRQLRDSGIEIAIDDFGTGYSSLAYLGRLPIGAVKIDRVFVGSMLSDESGLAIVRATVGLAHSLGFKVVAEGVESQAVLDRLGLFGCDLAQGYFIARPMPADALISWLTVRRCPAVRNDGKGNSGD